MGVLSGQCTGLRACLGETGEVTSSCGAGRAAGPEKGESTDG